MRRLLVAVLAAAPLRAQTLRAPALGDVVSAPAVVTLSAGAALAAPALTPALSLAPTALAAPLSALTAAAPTPAAAAIAAPAAAVAPVVSAAAPVAALAAAPAVAAAQPALPTLRAAAAWTPLAPSYGGAALRAGAGTPFENWLTRTPVPVDVDPAVLSALRRVRIAPVPGARPTPPAPRAPEPEPFLVRHHRAVRFFVAPLLRLIYRIDVDGRKNIPAGPMLLVSNHVSYMDPILLTFASGRQVRFLMFREYYEIWGLQWLFRALGALPISDKDPKWVTDATLARARSMLASGQSVGIFAEGHLTRNGQLDVFRRGFQRVALDGVPVITAGISGMWGSAFSRAPGHSFARRLRARLSGRRRVAVRLGPELDKIEPGDAQAAVAGLLVARP